MLKPLLPYPIALEYERKVAYFSMEFAIDQALKIYSGGLGFLAGSHLRSAYELRQNLIGVGILWKYGYYDQLREPDTTMKPHFIEKNYAFLEDPNIIFPVTVHDSTVYVKAWLLRPEIFQCAPLFLLSTDIPENDPVSRSITHRLYDANEATRVAQSIILGAGGAKLMDRLGFDPDVYHLNEGHALPLVFSLYQKLQSVSAVRDKVVFTTHTPETAGNEEHGYHLLEKMSFFQGLEEPQVKELLAMDGYNFNYTLGALKFARKANAVSRLHGEVATRMWASNNDICEIDSITNAQNASYWTDPVLKTNFEKGLPEEIRCRKQALKKQLFSVVADQTGKLFDEKTLTIVWARRIAGYKRADLLMRDWDRFTRLLTNVHYPVQIIWAGKPYPEDHHGIWVFNEIVRRAKHLANCAVLTGYELQLSAMLKKGSDVWLNNPVIYREASGTSGMTAAMNGSVNLSIPDGWIPEFARDKENCFLISPAADHLPPEERDLQEASNLYDVLENEILPLYYQHPERWTQIMRQAFADVTPAFDSGRMADEYYKCLYDPTRVTVS